eukprot:12927441-Prorocentrum_lima.AAC.1
MILYARYSYSNISTKQWSYVLRKGCALYLQLQAVCIEDPFPDHRPLSCVLAVQTAFTQQRSHLASYRMVQSHCTA